jgi:hypothetical protein
MTVTGSGKVEPYIQGEDVRRVIARVAPGSFPGAV